MSDVKNVSRMLFQFWDPIGINENKSLADEYDSYAVVIIKMYKNNNHDYKTYLNNIEKEMGLKQDLNGIPNPYNSRLYGIYTCVLNFSGILYKTLNILKFYIFSFLKLFISQK